jgi:EAL domain-containing protein (putative c-di-GMP-specific phosphodiesterase class I)
VDFRSEQIFRNRLLVFEGIINKYDLLKNNQVRMQLAAGLYVITEDRNKSVADMIDCASIVCEEAKNNSRLTYEFYTDSIREKINQNEHLEARMESALSGNEFRLFLQPKYNVSKDEIDSAEALVRWFDYQKGDYRYPAEFISLFESNGFIVEMDHFIYIEVLKYLSESKARGDKVVPISVNVSRVTAANADFINFYVGNKNRYMIDDDLITLEFTESYATEDYKKFSEIIVALHEGGIRCSVDDFGVGYSSFRVLKELDMDELKLDRLFLDKGFDIDRDDKLLTTITALAKSCGMTVVMEGVENKAMYDRVVRFGIGVIQGYYYAKPIPLEEFKIFVKSNTSIRYKAVVK